MKLNSKPTSGQYHQNWMYLRKTNTPPQKKCYFQFNVIVNNLKYALILPGKKNSLFFHLSTPYVLSLYFSTSVIPFLLSVLSLVQILQGTYWIGDYSKPLAHTPIHIHASMMVVYLLFIWRAHLWSTSLLGFILFCLKNIAAEILPHSASPIPLVLDYSYQYTNVIFIFPP